MHRFPASLITALAIIAHASTPDASTSPDRRSADQIEVHWGRKAYDVGELPERMGPGPRAALARWADWAMDRGYRMELSADGRVLLMLRVKRQPRKELGLIEETVEVFDALLPAPQRQEDGSPIPRLAEQGPLAAHTTVAPASRWIQVGNEPDTETIVLLGAESQADYESAVDLLAEGDPYLRAWAPGARRGAGFVLERPLCGVWLEDGAGQEEFDAHNELVHRLARLLGLRRFGRQPWWLTLGLAWRFEIEVRGTVYCFPYRSGFVSHSEHGSWPNRMRNLARSRDAEIGVDPLAGFQRGAWDDESAVLAWGSAKYLSLMEGDALSSILEDFRLLFNRKGIDRRTDGSWQIIVDYTPSPEDQQEVLSRHLGEGFEEEMKKALSKGKWPRRSQR